MNKLSTTFNQYKWILLLVVGILFLPTQFAFAGLEGVLYFFVVNTFGNLAGIGGVVLNYGLNYFVIGFGYQFDVVYGGIIDDLWAMIRDLFNLTFIFGLVYIGFKMILRSDDSGTRKWLVSLIIAALLVNFSLFITKFIIDFSNIMAVEIMNQAPDDIFTPYEDNDAQPDPISQNDVDLSESVNNMLRTVTLLSDDSGREMGELPEGASYLYVFGSAVLFIVSAFVFFSAGLMLIARGIVLLVFMVISPFLFLGMVLPMFQSVSSKLWSRLLKQAFLAPVYVAMLYISLSIGLQLNEDGNFVRAFIYDSSGSRVAELTNSLMPFIVIIILMLLSLAVAQKMGTESANAVMKVSNNVRRRGQKWAGRGARWGTSQTAGRAARYGTEKAGRYIGRGLQRLQQVEGSGAIARATRAAARSNAVQGTVGTATTNMQNAKFGLNRTIAEEQQMRNETERKAKRGRDVANGNPQETAAAARRMSPQEVAQLPQEQLDQIIQHLTDGQLNGMESAGLKTAAEVDTLRQKRDEQPIEEFNQAIDSFDTNLTGLDEAMSGLRRTIQGMTNDRRASLGFEQLSDPRIAMHLRDNDIDGLRDAGYDASQINDIEAARRNANGVYAQTGLPPTADGSERDPSNYTDNDIQNKASENRQKFMQDVKQASKLDPEVLANRDMANLLTPRVIEERLKNGKGMTEAEIAAIRNNIQDNVNEQNRRMWEQWNQRSTVAGELGLNFTSNQGNATDTSPEGIILDGSQSAVKSAREYRDSNSQDDLLNRNT